MRRPVIIMAGGTGGHVFPGTRARARAAARAVLAGRVARHAARARGALIPAERIPIEWLSIGGLRGKGVLTWLTAPFACARARAGARGDAPPPARGRRGPGRFRHRPRRRCRVAHCAARSSSTSRTRSRASPTAVSRIWRARCSRPFPAASAPRSCAQAIGNPVRADIAALPPPAQRFRIAQRGDPPAGARRQPGCDAPECGRAVCARPPRSDAARSTCAISQASAGSSRARQLRRAPACARRSPFIEDMADAYAWADLVICRAGALTVSELAAAGVAAILVPFPAAVDDHQSA